MLTHFKYVSHGRYSGYYQITDDQLGIHRIESSRYESDFFCLVRFYDPHGTVVENALHWLFNHNSITRKFNQSFPPSRYVKNQFQMENFRLYLKWRKPILEQLEKVELLYG